LARAASTISGLEAESVEVIMEVLADDAVVVSKIVDEEGRKIREADREEARQEFGE
jgi:hypothetical protein